MLRERKKIPGGCAYLAPRPFVFRRVGIDPVGIEFGAHLLIEDQSGSQDSYRALPQHRY
ncbi:hypothetical protein PT2222_210177 [Paraburkholderia tropica]